MDELEQLIEKFWAGTTTPAERSRLEELLEQQQESHRQKMQDAFLTGEPHPATQLGEDKAQQLLEQIHHRWNIPASTSRRIIRLPRYWRTIAAAACVGILATTLLLQHAQRTTRSSAPAGSPVIASRIVSLTNSSDTVQNITLKDGSVIQLQKNSGITYYEPFINNRRDISLAGVALFKVAKDKSRPFTVYAGGIVTRVLGTRFWVDADSGTKVKVRLLEGSVAVGTQPASAAKSQEVLLKAGQEIAIDKINRSYIVSTSTPASNNLASTAPKKNDNIGLAFNKEPLQQVFRKIGTTYSVRLSYHPEEMNGLFFTGTFLKSDELDLVLSTVCNVNDLSFTKEQDSIVISKLH